MLPPRPTRRSKRVADHRAGSSVPNNAAQSSGTKRPLDDGPASERKRQKQPEGTSGNIVRAASPSESSHSRGSASRRNKTPKAALSGNGPTRQPPRKSLLDALAHFPKPPIDFDSLRILTTIYYRWNTPEEDDVGQPARHNISTEKEGRLNLFPQEVEWGSGRVLLPAKEGESEEDRYDRQDKVREACRASISLLRPVLDATINAIMRHYEYSLYEAFQNLLDDPSTPYPSAEAESWDEAEIAQRQTARGNELANHVTLPDAFGRLFLLIVLGKDAFKDPDDLKDEMDLLDEDADADAKIEVVAQMKDRAFRPKALAFWRGYRDGFVETKLKKVVHERMRSLEKTRQLVLKQLEEIKDAMMVIHDIDEKAIEKEVERVKKIHNQLGMNLVSWDHHNRYLNRREPESAELQDCIKQAITLASGFGTDLPLLLTAQPALHDLWPSADEIGVLEMEEMDDINQEFLSRHVRERRERHAERRRQEERRQATSQLRRPAQSEGAISRLQAPVDDSGGSIPAIMFHKASSPAQDSIDGDDDDDDRSSTTSDNDSLDQTIGVDKPIGTDPYAKFTRAQLISHLSPHTCLLQRLPIFRTTDSQPLQYATGQIPFEPSWAQLSGMCAIVAQAFAEDEPHEDFPHYRNKETSDGILIGDEMGMGKTLMMIGVILLTGWWRDELEDDDQADADLFPDVCIKNRTYLVVDGEDDEIDVDITTRIESQRNYAHHIGRDAYGTFARTGEALPPDLPTIMIVPHALLDQTRAEIERYTTRLNVTLLPNSLPGVCESVIASLRLLAEQHRSDSPPEHRLCNHVVLLSTRTLSDLYRRLRDSDDPDSIFNFQFAYLMFDEVHLAKEDSLIQRATRAIKRSFSVGASGTLIVNRPSDIWRIANAMGFAIADGLELDRGLMPLPISNMLREVSRAELLRRQDTRQDMREVLRQKTTGLEAPPVVYEDNSQLEARFRVENESEPSRQFRIQQQRKIRELGAYILHRKRSHLDAQGKKLVDVGEVKRVILYYQMPAKERKYLVELLDREAAKLAAASGTDSEKFTLLIFGPAFCLIKEAMLAPLFYLDDQHRPWNLGASEQKEVISTKICCLLDVMRWCKAQGTEEMSFGADKDDSKILVYCDVLTIKPYLLWAAAREGVLFSTLDGDIKDQERPRIIAEFNKDVDHPICRSSYKKTSWIHEECRNILVSNVGSLGINLARADYCIFLTPQWSRAMAWQKICRANRTPFYPDQSKRDLMVISLAAANSPDLEFIRAGFGKAVLQRSIYLDPIRTSKPQTLRSNTATDRANAASVARTVITGNDPRFGPSPGSSRRALTASSRPNDSQSTDAQSLDPIGIDSRPASSRPYDSQSTDAQSLGPFGIDIRPASSRPTESQSTDAQSLGPIGMGSHPGDSTTPSLDGNRESLVSNTPFAPTESSQGSIGGNQSLAAQDVVLDATHKAALARQEAQAGMTDSQKEEMNDRDRRELVADRKAKAARAARTARSRVAERDTEEAQQRLLREQEEAEARVCEELARRRQAYLEKIATPAQLRYYDDLGMTNIIALLKVAPPEAWDAQNKRMGYKAPTGTAADAVETETVAPAPRPVRLRSNGEKEESLEKAWEVHDSEQELSDLRRIVVTGKHLEEIFSSEQRQDFERNALYSMVREQAERFLAIARRYHSELKVAFNNATRGENPQSDARLDWRPSKQEMIQLRQLERERVRLVKDGLLEDNFRLPLDVDGRWITAKGHKWLTSLYDCLSRKGGNSEGEDELGDAAHQEVDDEDAEV